MTEKNAYEIIQIDESSWRIEEGHVRALLFCGSDKAILIDSGFGTGNIRDIVVSLTGLPVVLVNTHADRDHTGCNALFEEAFMHPAEYDRYHQSDNGAGLIAHPLWEGDIIDIGGRSFEVILIPGHTPGSIALLDAKNRVLISGDSVQSSLIYMFGPGRNIHAYIQSMEKLRGMRHRFDIAYPSHGTFPVGADILDGLIGGAKRLLNGELDTADPPFELPAPLYDVGVAKFLYQAL